MQAFDETMNGYGGEFTVNPFTLKFPMITFPKGSFFPNATYGLDLKTNKLLRPGIDYVYLNLNKDIPYSTNEIINSKMKKYFICNVVLFKKQFNNDIKWTIGYTGGEDDDRPNIYANEINRLYNLAAEKGTTNLFTNPKQGYGCFTSIDNTQTISPTFQFETIGKENKFETLSLAIAGLSDVALMGGDPLLIDAYEQWIKNSSLVLNDQAKNLMQESEKVLNSNDSIRVSNDQFIHTDSKTTPNNQNFLEHKNVILRGLEDGNKVGFFGLGSSANNVVGQSTHILQRKDKPTTFDSDTYIFFSESLIADTINVKVKNRTSSNKKTKLYVVSRKLRKTILEVDISTLYKSAGLKEKQYTLEYPIGKYSFDTDTLFAYVVDEDGNGDFTTTAMKDIAINNVSYGYAMSLSNNGKLISVNDTSGNSSKSVDVILKRAKTDYKQTTYLKCEYDVGSESVTINGVNQIKFDWLVGESEKRITVNLKENLNATANAIVFKHLSGETVLSSMLIGIKNTQSTPYAFIQVVNSLDDTSVAFGIDVITQHYLVVTHSQTNIDYTDSITPIITKLNNKDISFELSSPIKLSDGRIAYPIKFSGEVNSLFNISVTDKLNRLTSNNLELVINKNAGLETYKLTFAYINAGWDYYQIKQGDNYITHFMLPLKTTYPDGLMYDVSCDDENLSLPTFVITKDSRITFTAVSSKPVKNNLKLTFRRNNLNYDLVLTMNSLDNLDFRIQYQTGEVSKNKLSLNAPMKMEVVNNFAYKTIKLTRSNYSGFLKVKNAEFDQDGFVNELVLNPNEVKPLTNGNWITLNKYLTELETGGNFGRYAPNYDVVILNQDGTVYKAGNIYNFIQQVFVPKTTVSLVYYNQADKTLAISSSASSFIEIKVDLPDGVSANEFSLKDLESNWNYEISNTYLNETKNSFVCIVKITPNFFKKATIPNMASLTLSIKDTTLNTTYDQFITMRVI